MTRAGRRIAQSDIYHVVERGAGRRVLFEDDGDRKFFLEKLHDYAQDNKVLLLAMCLMDNHVHLLLKGKMDDLVCLMRSLNTSFARHYNGKHGHVGPVFQDRFASYPVEEDAYLMEVVRYIHLNPDRAGIGRCDNYRWSSYAAYLKEHPAKELEDILDMFGGRDAFVAFHSEDGVEVDLTDIRVKNDQILVARKAVSDGEAIDLARDLFGDKFSTRIASMGKADRDRALQKLRTHGLSVRQIERLTGIGRGVIQRCKV